MMGKNTEMVLILSFIPNLHLCLSLDYRITAVLNVRGPCGLGDRKERREVGINGDLCEPVRGQSQRQIAELGIPVIEFLFYGVSHSLSGVSVDLLVEIDAETVTGLGTV